MPYPEKFEGFTVHDPKTWQTFHKEEFKVKPFGEWDIDIAVDACGVCGSDVHTITGGWGENGADFEQTPICVGHEVIGRAVKVGPKVTEVKIGQRVGVGAQVSSCLKCKQCKSDNENYCPEQVDTYGAPYPDGSISQGGFAGHIRVHEYFVFPIPEKLDTNIAAPMMCAGLTVYSPLVRNGVGPGKKVAIVGMGGLGHFAVMFAVALGAEVTVLSHTANKKEDAMKMGAKDFVLTTDEKWAEPLAFTFDFILNASDMTNLFKIDDYLSTLVVHGRFWNVGLPDKPFPEITGFSFAPNGAIIGGSHIGCRKEVLAMLELVGDKNIKSWIEEIPISAEGIKEAVTRLKENDIRYRFVLTEFDKAFGTAEERGLKA